MRIGSTILANDKAPRVSAFPRRPRFDILRRWLATGIALAILCATPCSAGRGAADARKYAVIAAFLYNFFLYVEWPDDPDLNEGPLTIGVLGDNPFGEALNALEKRHVQGRAIEVLLFDSVESLVGTHILFLPTTSTGRLPEVHRALKGRPVLTVGESENFTRNGGVVRFFETGDAQRIGVEINQTAAAALELRIRAKLLRLASLVEYPLPAPNS